MYPLYPVYKFGARTKYGWRCYFNTKLMFNKKLMGNTVELPHNFNDLKLNKKANQINR